MSCKFGINDYVLAEVRVISKEQTSKHFQALGHY